MFSLLFTTHMPFNKIQCISWAFSGYRVQSYQNILVGEYYLKYRLEKHKNQAIT